jgi:hypothetical protein
MKTLSKYISDNLKFYINEKLKISKDMNIPMRKLTAEQDSWRIRAFYNSVNRNNKIKSYNNFLNIIKKSKDINKTLHNLSNPELLLRFIFSILCNWNEGIEIYRNRLISVLSNYMKNAEDEIDYFVLLLYNENTPYGFDIRETLKNILSDEEITKSFKEYFVKYMIKSDE